MPRIQPQTSTAGTIDARSGTSRVFAPSRGRHMAGALEQAEKTTEDTEQPAQRMDDRETIHPSNKRRQTPVPPFLAAVAFVGYLTLLLVLRSDRKIKGDLATTIFLQRQDHPWLARVMRMVSWFGFRPQSVVLPASAIGGSWLFGFRMESIFMLLAWGSSLASFLTKLVVRRPRPDDPLIRISEAKIRDTSFPSGHTIHYLTFWGFVIYLVFTKTRNRFVRWLTVAVFGPLIAIVGPSRIYLGHHWLTDVLGSYLFGTAYLLGLISLYRRVRGLEVHGDPDERVS